MFLEPVTFLVSRDTDFGTVIARDHWTITNGQSLVIGMVATFGTPTVGKWKTQSVLKWTRASEILRANSHSVDAALSRANGVYMIGCE